MFENFQHFSFSIFKYNIGYQRAEIHEMFVRIANRVDPELLQMQSDLGLHCLSRTFWQATIVQNF